MALLDELGLRELGPDSRECRGEVAFFEPPPEAEGLACRTGVASSALDDALLDWFPVSKGTLSV